MARTRSSRIPRALSFLTKAVTKRNGEAQALLAEQARILETLARGAPLEEVLTAIVKMVEERAQGMLCSILLLNKEDLLLRPGVGPSLPDSFYQALAQGTPIGPSGSSCAACAYSGEPVITTDIASDPIWADNKALAIGNGLCACWSTPIFSSDREVLGTFAMYYHEPRSPGEHELRLIEVATHMAGIAIEGKLTEEALRASEERFRHLYTATPAMLHAIDREGRIVSVSDLWLEVLGYERSEAIGRKSVEFLTEESRRDAEEVALPEFWKRGAARDIPYQFVRKDGEIVDILLSAITERDKDGNAYRTLAVLTDITERKQLEAQLQRAREELEGKVERQMLRKNPYGLTFRELTILHPLAAGRSDKEIATDLVISPLTVQKHVSNILGKMDASSRTEAATRALKEGLID